MGKKALILLALVGTLTAAAPRAEAVCQTYQSCVCDEPTYCFSYYCYDYTYDPATGEYYCVQGHDNADKHVLYIHGRSSSTTRADAMVPVSSLPLDWDARRLFYDGDARLWASPNDTIKDALRTYCRNGHYCVVVAYSAGVNRLLYAINQLNAEGTPPTGMLWASALASAAGGTSVARYTTKWNYRFIARLAGFYAEMDNDLLDTQWGAGGQYSNLQNLMPVATYHTGAGTQDMCFKAGGVKALFSWAFTGKTKFCGNPYMPGGAGDGLVPVSSACGYADQGVHWSCCEPGYKYANRTFDSLGSCSYSQNHIDTIASGFKVAGARVVTGAQIPYTASGGLIPAGGPEPLCNPAFWDCDWFESDDSPYLYVYQGFENATPQTNLRPFTCGACNVYGMGQATYTGEYWYTNYDDYWCQYYFECYSYPVYYWSVETSWGQPMTCYSYDASGNSPSCY